MNLSWPLGINLQGKFRSISPPIQYLQCSYRRGRQPQRGVVHASCTLRCLSARFRLRRYELQRPSSRSCKFGPYIFIARPGTRSNYYETRLVCFADRSRNCESTTICPYHRLGEVPSLTMTGRQAGGKVHELRNYGFSSPGFSTKPSDKRVE